MVGLLLEREADTRIVLVILDKLLPEAAVHIDELDKEKRERIEVLVGDAAGIDMGLSGREYRDLAGVVTRVHHMAHVSYVGVDDDTAKYANVRGAVEMVELGKAADRLRCIVHHSTAHVSGDRTGTVFEDELDCGQSFHSPVQQSRYEAERVLRRAMPQLPIAVVRPTMIVGDSITGEFERLDGANLLVMLVLGLPETLGFRLPAPGEGPFDVVPLDHVVRAAHAIGRDERTAGRTFHLTSTEQLSARHVFDLIAQAGGLRVSDRRTFPSKVASAILRTPGMSRLIHEPRALLQQLATPARYDTRNAERILGSADIACPPLASYVDTWVKAVDAHLQRRRA